MDHILGKLYNFNEDGTYTPLNWDESIVSKAQSDWDKGLAELIKTWNSMSNEEKNAANIETKEEYGFGITSEEDIKRVYETEYGSRPVNDETYWDIFGKNEKNHKYREPVCLEDKDTSSKFSGEGIALLKNIVGLTGTDEQVVEQWKTNLQNEFDDMINSIKINKGFYVARYETSLCNEKAQSKMKRNPVTANVSSANSWYGLYQKEKEYSQQYELKDAVGSSMIWGSQYDQIMMWMKKSGYNVASTTPKTGIIYNNSQITGKEANKDVMNNVNDLLGCCYEWTLEAESTDCRIYRGGCYKYNIDSPSNRGGILGYPEYHNGEASSRMTLYVK